jgi:predicted RNase H-like nuclease
MLNGAKLFAALEKSHKLLDDETVAGQPVCFETFPQAVACALAGERVSAKQKGTVRRGLLVRAGVATEALTNIDRVDAALCALAAHRFLQGRYRKFGDARSGYIVTPDAGRAPGSADG